MNHSWKTASWPIRAKVVAFILGFFVAPVISVSVPWFASVPMTLLGIGAFALWFWSARDIIYEPGEAEPQPDQQAERKIDEDSSEDVQVLSWQSFGLPKDD